MYSAIHYTWLYRIIFPLYVYNCVHVYTCVCGCAQLCRYTNRSEVGLGMFSSVTLWDGVFDWTWHLRHHLEWQNPDPLESACLHYIPRAQGLVAGSCNCAPMEYELSFSWLHSKLFTHGAISSAPNNEFYVLLNSLSCMLFYIYSYKKY